MSLARRKTKQLATRGLFWDSLIQSGCWLFFGGCLVLSYWQPQPIRAHLGTLFILAVAVLIILPVWQFFSALHFTVEYGRRWQLWIIAADVLLIVVSLSLPGRWRFWSDYGVQLLFLFSLLHTGACWVDYLRQTGSAPARYPELLDVE